MLLRVVEFLNAGIELSRAYTLGVFLALYRPVRTFARDALYGIDLEELQGPNGQQDEGLVDDLMEDPLDEIGDDEGEVEEEEEEGGAEEEPDRLPVFPPLDCSPLSFFDNFIDIGGVPMFILGKDEWTDAVPEFEEPVFDETAPQKIALPPPMEEDSTWTISCCRFSASGSRIVTGHCDGSVRLWDADHGVPLQCKEDMHECAVGDVCFRGENDGAVLSCGCQLSLDGTFVIWDTVNDVTTRIDASEHWLKRRLRHPKLLEPRFSEDGLAAIFPVRSCAEGLDSSDGEAYEGDELLLLTRVVVAESAIEPKKNDEQVCWFFVLDTWAIPGVNHLLGYCSIPIVHDFTLTSMSLSPDGRSVMVGFMNLALSDGYVVLWPDYKHSGSVSVKLDGTLGAWSPRSLQQQGMVVTWTVPADILPEEGSGGACFLWKMDSAREWAADNTLQPLEMISQMQSPEDELKVMSPDVLRSRWGGDVLWCDFVIHHDGNLRVVSCNVSDRVDIVFWDTIALVATHRLTPEVGDLQMTLGNKEMWQKKWLVGDAVRGLQPLMVSRDRAWLSLVDGAASKVYIWNAAQAVEVFRLQFPDDVTRRLGHRKDIVLGRQPGKFVLLGSECMIAGATRPPYQDGLRGSLTASLKYADSRYDMLKNHPVGKFSHNGGLLGLVHPFSMVMHVWDLDTGQKLPQVSSDWASKFVHFAFSQDGKQMVTYMSDNVVKLWELDEIGTTQPVVVDKIQEDVESRIGCTGLGFSQDEEGEKTIVACEMLGNLVWWRTKREEEVAPVQEKTRSWSTVKDMFHGGSPLNRVSSLTPLRSRSISWTVVERLQADGQHASRFSSDGLRAVLLGKTRETVVWDLVRRVALKTFKFEVPFERTKLFFPEHVPMSGDRAFVGRGDFGAEFQKCHPSTTVEDLKARVVQVPRNMFVSEDGNWVLYDEFVSPENRFKEKVSMSTNTKIRTVQKLFIADTTGYNRPLEVVGSKLAPSLLLIMSPDGRRVACMTSKYTVKVWCAYSSSGLIPDFKLLKSSGRLHNRQFVKDLLQEMGPSLLNYPDHSGLSVLYRALLDGRDMMRDSLLRWALKNSVKVRILHLGSGSNTSSNALEFALKQKSPGSARTMMRFALLGAVHDSDLAVMLQESLVKLGAAYPKILLETLEDSRMTLELGSVQVPDFVIARREFLVTTDPRMRPQKEKLHAIWKELTKKFKQKSVKGTMMVPCIARVIPYPDAAQIGKRGVLRNLLLARADHNAFSALPIKVIIWFKWKTFARRMLLDELWHYGLLLFCFTTYSIQLGKEKSGKDIGTATLLFLLFSSVLAGMNLLREFKQMIVYTKSHGIRGFLHWVTSGWNWIEIISYILLMAVLPLAHFMDSFLEFTAISSTVAVASIMLWWKILYYAKAFVSTGPLVIMIGAIIQDITFFLVLAFMVLFGFGVAFFVLYRGLLNDRSLNPELTDEEFDDIEAAFSTVPRSLMTMFAFMLGDFNLASIYGSPAPQVSVFLFLLYMMIMTIVLLNLLIAVMGDSFARIKNSEEKEFLKARASAIDDVESMMSTHARDRLQKDIFPFIHMLMPKEHKEGDEEEEGHKKVLDMQLKLKHDLKYNMRAGQLAWRRIEDDVKNISLQIHKLKKREESDESEGGSDYAAASFGSLSSLSTWVGDHTPEYSSDTS